MERLHVELITPYHQADLHREAAAARRLAAVPRRSFAPTLLFTPLLVGLGRLLIDAGSWLQRLDRACPNCPSPSH
jgi:hypothetical protein